MWTTIRKEGLEWSHYSPPCSNSSIRMLDTPIRLLSSWNFILQRALVKMSASWFSVRINTISMFLSSIHCRMKWYLLSICLVRLWWTGFLLNVIADWLSTISFTPFCSSCFNSLISRFIQRAWHAAPVAAMYSASHEDRATMLCFCEDQLIAISPKKNICLEVLFQSPTSPAKSLSL